jgi:hypothetical protein
MPGLVRGMARTAAVVGTATVTRNAVNRRQAKKNTQAYAEAANTVYAEQAPPPVEEYVPEAQDALPPVDPEEDVIRSSSAWALYAQGILPRMSSLPRRRSCCLGPRLASGLTPAACKFDLDRD